MFRPKMQVFLTIYKELLHDRVNFAQLVFFSSLRPGVTRFKSTHR